MHFDDKIEEYYPFAIVGETYEEMNEVDKPIEID